MYRKLELQYMQWWHSKVLKAACSVRKKFKSRTWNTRAARYKFQGVYPGHEPAKCCDDPLKRITWSVLMYFLRFFYKCMFLR